MVDDDVILFLRTLLRDYAEEVLDYHLPEDWDWPSSDDIDSLYDQSRGRFTDASTLASLVCSTMATLEGVTRDPTPLDRRKGVVEMLQDLVRRAMAWQHSD